MSLMSEMCSCEELNENDILVENWKVSWPCFQQVTGHGGQDFFLGQNDLLTEKYSVC